MHARAPGVLDGLRGGKPRLGVEVQELLEQGAPGIRGFRTECVRSQWECFRVEICEMPRSGGSNAEEGARSLARTPPP